jgi:hypothetical protein
MRKGTLRDFSSWLPIYEAKDQAGTRSKEALEQVFGPVKHVPDFIEFSRDGEPAQVAHLFADKRGNTFSFNYTNSGELYSVDLYPSGSVKPTVTLYANGSSDDQMVKALANKLSLKEAKSGSDEDDVVITYDTGKQEHLKMPKHGPAPKHHEEPEEEPAAKIKAAETQITEEKPKPKKGQQVQGLPMGKSSSGVPLDTDYEFGDPSTIFKDLEKYTELVGRGIQPALLICGSAGVGKSFKVNKTLQGQGLERNKDYFVIKGKATAAGMYIKLFENNGKLTIFDDCDSVFDDDNGVNILKGALDSDEVREISWTGAHPIKSPTTGAVIPSSFEFTGQAMFITNRSKKSLSSVLGPIKSRSFVIEVALAPSDMIEYIKGLLPTMMKGEPTELKEFAFKLIQKVAAKNPTVDMNLRTMQKAVKIVKYVDDLADAKRMIEQQCTA